MDGQTPSHVFMNWRTAPWCWKFSLLGVSVKSWWVLTLSISQNQLCNFPARQSFSLSVLRLVRASATLCHRGDGTEPTQGHMKASPRLLALRLTGELALCTFTKGGSTFLSIFPLSDSEPSSSHREAAGWTSSSVFPAALTVNIYRVSAVNGPAPFPVQSGQICSNTSFRNQSVSTSSSESSRRQRRAAG